MALRVPRTFDGPTFGGVLDVLLPTPPTAPESAYRVVEPLQNAAPERRVPPSWPERISTRQARSREASRLGVRRCGLRREPAAFGGGGRGSREPWFWPSSHLRQVLVAWALVKVHN